jgi:hypothetical protein
MILRRKELLLYSPCIAFQSLFHCCLLYAFDMPLNMQKFCVVDLFLSSPEMQVEEYVRKILLQLSFGVVNIMDM